MRPWSPDDPALFAGKVKEATNIVEVLKERFWKKHNKAPADFVGSWESSLRPFIQSLNDHGFSDHGLMLELEMPGWSARLDGLLVGQTTQGAPSMSLLEFKGQERPEMKIVRGAQRQAANYQAYLQHCHSWLRERDDARISSCVHFHNAKIRKVTSEAYEPGSEYIRRNYLIDEVPQIFAADTSQDLMKFLQERTGTVTANIEELLEEISGGFVMPSLEAIRAFAELLRGHPSFIPLGDQSKVCDQLLTEFEAAQKREQPTLCIVQGGPGTGKTVLAMHLLRMLSEQDEEKGREAKFCYAAPGGGTVPTLKHVLSGAEDRMSQGIALHVMLQHAKDLTPAQRLEAVVIDEGHRLQRKKMGEAIQASRFSVLLLDELQAITPGCARSVRDIEDIGRQTDFHVAKAKLAQQLRYRGGEQWVSWVNTVLEIPSDDKCDLWNRSDIFPAMVADSAEHLVAIMEDLHRQRHHCRYVAGYCWGDAEGVKIGGLRKPWYTERKEIKQTWSIHPKGFEYVGAPYFTQNFEFDYVGVIIGPDLRFDGQRITADMSKTKDNWLRDCGPDEFLQLVKNIYRMLMTRGRKGCFIHCEDAALREYLQSRIDPKMSQSWPQEIVARSTDKFAEHHQTSMS